MDIEETFAQEVPPEPAGGPSEESRGWAGLRALHSFRYRDFRWLWLGTFFAFTAVAMQQITRGWLIL
ncbi:MAG: hypothetical protein JW821_18045, partial [Deltaproteobacteria bacterium]|nr:hypothetical protein [Deltaproteobacteria bacterium]